MERFTRGVDPETGETYSLVGDTWIVDSTGQPYQGEYDMFDLDTGQRYEPNEAGTAWQPVETSFWADDPTRQDRWRTGLSNIGGGALQGFAGMMEGPAIAAGALGWVDDPQDTMLGRAGGALRDVSADLPRNPDFEGEFVADTLGNAVGSGLSFLAGGGGVGAGLRAAGLGARALTAGTVATTGALGASVGGAEGFRDALAHGADIETAYESAGGNAAFGLTEAAPIAGFLGRLDRRTGGSVRRALVSAVRQGGEEAIQEAVQTIGANAIAEGLYDPDRGMFEHVGEGAAAGFTVGALFGFVGNTLFGRRGRAGQRDQVPPPADQQPVTEETQETTDAPQPPFRQGERIRFRYGDQDLQGSVEEIIETTEGPAARVRLQDGSELDVLIDEMQDVGPDLLALPPPERRTAAEQRQQEAEVLPAGEETIVPPAPIQGPEQTAAPAEQQEAQPDTDLQQTTDLPTEVPVTGPELTIEPMASGQSFLVRGNTEAHADRIRGVRGGRWNQAQNAFMFPNGRRAEVERQLGDLLAPGQATATETVETTEVPAETVTEAPSAPEAPPVPATETQLPTPAATPEAPVQTELSAAPVTAPPAQTAPQADTGAQQAGTEASPAPADQGATESPQAPETGQAPPVPADTTTPPLRPLREIFGIDTADQPAAVPEEQYATEPTDRGPQETGPFGPVLRQFEGNYRDAALELERRQSGEAVGALSHPEVGPIALVWGKPGTGRHDGYGLSKIVAWHPEVVADLPDRLARMRVTRRSPARIRLQSENDEAGLRLDWDGVAKTWLMTAYEKGARRTEKTPRTLQELLEAGDVPQSPRRATNNVGDTEARDNAEPAQEDRAARRPRRTTPEATDQPATEDGDQDGLGDVDPEFRHSALTSGAGDIEFTADLGNAGPELAAELKKMWQDMGLPLSQLTLTDQVLTGRGQALQDSGLDLSALEAPIAGKTVGQMAYISLTGSDPHSALWHEAFHVLENMGVFRPSEIETMARNPEKMRRMAAISWQTLPDDPVLERLSDRELRAYAYEGWRRRKDRGEGADLTVPPAIRRAFSRLYRMLERVRNFLAGRGYQSIDDIFARVTAGQVTTAADQQTPLSEQYRLDQDLMKQIVKGVRESSKATQGLIRRVWSQNPPPNVTIIEKASTRSVNGFMRYLATPQAVFRKFPNLRRLIDQGIDGERQMSANVNRLGKKFRDIRSKLNRSEFERVSQTLFEGDTQQAVFTDAQLRQFGLNEKEQAAYREIRDLFDQIGRLVDQHRRTMLPQVRAERLRLERRLGSALADARVMDTAEFRTLMGKRSVLRSRVRAGTATPKMQQDLADIEQRLSGLQAKNTNDQQRIDDLRQKMQQMEQRLDETSVRRIAGYVPHRFFGSWRLRRQTGVDQNGNPTWENVRSEDGFWRSRIDAVNEARRLSADEPGAQLRIEPVGFKWPFQDEGTQLSDAAYNRFVSRVREQFGVEGQELRDLIQDVARKRFRRRIAPFAQRRLGVEGYSRDMERVIYNHIAQAVRYTVLDRLKFDAINTMEREGLSENRVLTQEQKGLQQALQAWWRDVNGQKQGSEIQFDEILDRAERNPLFASGMTMGAVGFAATAMVNPWFGAALGGYFGYRTYKAITNGGEFKARYLTGSLLNDAAHLKLGAFVNLGSAVVNMTQVFLNTYPILGEKYTLVGYRKASEALWDSARGKTTDLTRMMERNNIETLFRLGDTSHLFEKEGRIARASMFFFQSAETLNRATTFFGALEKARAEGKNEAQAQAYAREVVNRTQFHFGNANKPEILRNWFARVPLQFKNFLVQQLSFVVGLGKEAGRGNVRPLARFMLAMTLTAGVLGWPFMELLDIIMSQLFDFSPMQETANVAIDMMAEGEIAGSIAGLMARGMPSLFGVDISQRTGMGDGFFPTRATDLYGPWIGTVINTGDLMRQGANTADVLRSVTAGAAPLQTLETAANGQSILWDAVARPDQFFGALGDDRAMVTNPRLRGSLEYEPTAAEMALRTVGLRPMHESNLTAIRQGIRREELIRQRQVRPYLNRIADAMATENRSEIGRIIQEARQAGIIITPEQARRAARDRVIDRGQRELRTAPRVVRPEFQERQRILEEGRQ